MGTTVTTNLALIKPDTDESIKAVVSPPSAGWAAQNTINCNTIDALFKSTNGTYTPVFTAGATPVVLGTGGFVEGKMLRLFPRMVIGFFRIAMGGAGFVPGAGTYRITFPTGMTHLATELTTFFESPPIGKGILHDDSTILSSSVLTVHYDLSTGTIHFRSKAAGSPAALVNPTSPITFAQLDRISGYFIYPTTDA